MKTLRATITFEAGQLEALLNVPTASRHAAMVRQHGEACTKAQAARLINCSPNTIRAMLADGRLLPACGGTRVDVRSLAAYIEDRGKERRLGGFAPSKPRGRLTEG